MRCVNRYDKRWIATRRYPSASWTPNQPKRPKQATNAASTGEQRSTGANSNAGGYERLPGGVLVHSADISDAEGAEWLLAAHHHSFPRMHEIRADEG